MESNQNNLNAGVAANKEGGSSTIFEQAIEIQVELHGVMEQSVEPTLIGKVEKSPKWILKILERLKLTIIKPVLKLRPTPGKVDWRNYGRIIGVLERQKKFLTQDIPRIIEEEFSVFTDEDWERIAPQLGLDKLRQYLIKVIGRPVADDEPLEKLVDEAWAMLLSKLDHHQQVAAYHLNRCGVKETNLFYKGVTEGLGLFLDENARFTGDRGRTSLYFDVLALRDDIEKKRLAYPKESRRDLQTWMIKKARLRISSDPEWFDHFCDEICLSMKGVGRKPKVQTG